ncbi:MAG: hypothetical protein AAFP02_05655 [Bacteroidota bacterium]
MANLNHNFNKQSFLWGLLVAFVLTWFLSAKTHDPLHGRYQSFMDDDLTTIAITDTETGIVLIKQLWRERTWKVDFQEEMRED